VFVGREGRIRRLPTEEKLYFVAVADSIRRMTGYTTVASIDDVLPGERTTVQVDGEGIALFNVEGELYAVKNECTHQAHSLDEGDVRDGILTCPLHRGSFDLESGEVVGPPPEDPLPCYDVRRNGSDIEIQVG
jgi:3-phenylpropionate/trans-cinnamate dioxygenase ferredoxin subunit